MSFTQLKVNEIDACFPVNFPVGKKFADRLVLY